MTEIELSDQEFTLFQKEIHQGAGICLSPSKKSLVAGRLMKRLRYHGFNTYKEYFLYATQGEGRTSGEYNLMIDSISTNETHFFREPHHFDFLGRRILPQESPTSDNPFRVWSAACSSGEEPYSIAVVLSEHFGTPHAPFEILATDINETILQKARTAVYPLSQLGEVPKPYLSKYFLKGVRGKAGTFRAGQEIRQKVAFRRLNLNEPLPSIGLFDLIFCRNVMIYFDTKTRQQVVARLAGVLKKGGYLFIGHSESLNGVTDALKAVRPTMYRKEQV